MCDNNRDNECRCLNEILTVICILQKNASNPECCLDTCDRGFLGNPTSTLCFNTRPIMLYTCCSNGTPWSMPVTRDNVVCKETEDNDVREESKPTCSSVFRIEKIDECCATFRVLAKNPDTDDAAVLPYVSTNSFFTMNLECVCCLRCLPDTFVECI